MLMKFNYYPIKSSLNYDEFSEFEKLTRKIGKKMAMMINDDEIAQDLTNLFILRATILKKSNKKLVKLNNLLNRLLNESRNEKKNKISKLVIFCKDGEQVSDVIQEIIYINKLDKCTCSV